MTLTHELDAAQVQVKSRLEALSNALKRRPTGLLQRLGFSRAKPVKGLYIWGNVGRGKTMLMDGFFAEVSSLPKRRVHFHAFMQEIHAARAIHQTDDVIAEIADGIARQCRLLCLDEMQVVDIADAMILGRLFEALWARGLVIVTTSNQPPEGLYKDGLNRQLFLPFVARLNEMLDVTHLSDGKDYRLGRVAEEATYVTPLGLDADAALNALWAKLADADAGKPVDLTFLGRTLHVPRAAHSCARFGFSDLVERALGVPDFLAIANHFGTVFIDGVRIFKASERNQIRRFILLIDTLYDAGTRLVVSAEAAPENLCRNGPHRVEFLRTASRLREMQSQNWWLNGHSSV